MNKHEACIILNIPTTFTKEELKQAFRINALKYHPDKSNNDTKEHFIKIHQAYKYLSNDLNNYTYNDLLKEFVAYIDKDNCIMIQLVDKLANLTEDISLHIFQKIDIQCASSIYSIIIKYSDIFKIDSKLLVKIGNIIENRTKSNNIFIIRPSLEDLFLSNIYKLIYEKETYYVPMWHEELHYDNSNNIIVRCIPQLDNNISIDHKNNIHINIYKNIQDIIDKECINVQIVDNNLSIPVANLYIRRCQIVSFKDKGIPIINHTDIYNNNERSDIYVHIYLDLLS